MSKRYSYITRAVFMLSMVSLFTDMASEMIYPIMPVFLRSIGFSVALIGILEGFAEMVAGLSKGYFGQLSDNRQRRLPFVRWGYTLSAVSKPMLAAFQFPLWIFFARTVDRTGKGLRTAPRDALLSAQTTPEFKARVFGFHRAMDTMGAVLGPSLALVILYYLPENYRALFLIAFIPGLIAVLFTWMLKEKPGEPQHKKVQFFSFFGWLKKADPAYKKLLIGLLIFALVNSSDVLLLLKMKQSGMPDRTVIFTYIFYNLIYAIASFPMGVLADRLGTKTIFIVGLILFTIVYSGFAQTDNTTTYWILFFLYGIYAACTEGVAKAWISNITPKSETGTAIGTYTSLMSVCTFVASSTAGLLWTAFGAGIAFGFTAAVTALVAIYFFTVPAKPAMAHN